MFGNMVIGDIFLRNGMQCLFFQADDVGLPKVSFKLLQFCCAVGR